MMYILQSTLIKCLKSYSKSKASFNILCVGLDRRNNDCYNIFLPLKSQKVHGTHFTFSIAAKIL